MRRVTRSFLLGVACLAILPAGCAREEEPIVPPTGRVAPPPPSPDELTHTIVIATDYFLESPVQERPADGRFPAGTQVAEIEAAGAWSKVADGTGVFAWVDSSTLREKRSGR